MKTAKLVADGICGAVILLFIAKMFGICGAVILLFIAKMFITQCSDTSLYCC
jgi:uncharacterized membrane protein YeaQ/YmgE (transglycosylase-associated protein family)